MKKRVTKAIFPVAGLGTRGSCRRRNRYPQGDHDPRRPTPFDPVRDRRGKGGGHQGIHLRDQPGQVRAGGITSTILPNSRISFARRARPSFWKRAQSRPTLDSGAIAYIPAAQAAGGSATRSGAPAVFWPTSPSRSYFPMTSSPPKTPCLQQMVEAYAELWRQHGRRDGSARQPDERLWHARCEVRTWARSFP